jgi:hypothetical protein
MRQAQFQAISQEIREIKQELREFIILMSTTDLEKQNLEAHVDLCSERYKGLHDRLSAIEISLKRMNEDMLSGQKSSKTTIIMTAGTVIAGLLSTMVVLLIKMPIQ